MTTTSATSATQSIVSSLGAGSGVDMAALATNLATAQFASRVDRLTTKSETLTAQISSASNIKSMLMGLSTSLGDMVRTGSLSPQPQVANPAVASATLSGTHQPSGSFSLEVTTLAKGQTLASTTFDGKEAMGAGTLKLRFGTVDGGFSESGSAAVDIAIPANATLNDVAGLINAKKSGVTAYVANTSNGAQLVLKGTEGTANGFVVETPGAAAGSALSRLAWAPGSGSGTLLASAGDAAFKLDGLELTATSNTVTDVIPGVALKLAATNVDKPTTITFADASASITSAMTDLTSALNEIAGALNTATNPTNGELRSDSGARPLKLKMGQLAGTPVMPNATGAAKTLADLGLSTQRDGTFVLDTKRLSATLAADPEGVAAMFTTGLYGVYSSVDKLYRGVSAVADPGSLGGSITRMNKQLQEANQDKSDLAERQETLRATLTARFAKSDSRIAQSQSTLTFLQNQIAAWNKPGN